jgi:hypothetical protein
MSVIRISTVSTQPPIIARDGADQQADRRCDDGDQRHHHQGQAGAMNHPAEDVAGEIIGAHQVIHGGRQQPLGTQVATKHRIVRRNDIGKDGDQNQQDNDGQADHAEPVAGEQEPGAPGLAETGLAARGRLFALQPVAEVLEGGTDAHARLLTRGSSTV